jgi:Na+/phosphate symporter
MENGEKNYQESVYYLDIVNELERMGDFIINISQDLKKSFVHK